MFKLSFNHLIFDLLNSFQSRIICLTSRIIYIIYFNFFTTFNFPKKYQITIKKKLKDKINFTICERYLQL